MFKTDKKSLEDLSFRFDESDIANFKAILEHLKSNNLLTISKEEVQRALNGLDAVGKLKLDGKIYAFHVYDAYAARENGSGEGIELYLRQGDKLKAFHVTGDRSDIYCIEETCEFLKREKKSKIYTGQIPQTSSFLGLSQELKDENEDEYEDSFPITRDILNDGEIEDFESEGIQVVKLESLI